MELRIDSKIRSGLFFAAIGAIVFIAAFMAASAFPAQDLAQYWAAGHLVAKNPYSMQLTADFERSFGFSGTALPLVIKNPPWAILFVLPLGLLSYQCAFAFWALVTVILVAGCARAVWGLFSLPPSLGPVLLPFLFGPTIVLLMLGQWTILVLLGITLFLIMAERQRDWLAGASLVLVLGKPHVAFLFLLAVLLWSIQFKRWLILLSGTLALAISSIVILAINHQIFTQFVQRTNQVVDETVSYPNLGGMLYVASGYHFLALVPELLGIVWLVFYWRKHRDDWDWKREGMIALLVSVACSYYSYPYDEVLVLPALIAAFANGNRRIFLSFFVATNLGYAVYLFKIVGGLSYMFLWWTASAWLITYVLSRSRQFSSTLVQVNSAD